MLSFGARRVVRFLKTFAKSAHNVGGSLTLVLFLWLLILPVAAGDLPPGIVAGVDYMSVPVPASRYQVYLVGEFHGAGETKSVLLGMLTKLHQEVGLRDVALEEDQVYQRAARDYVGRMTDRLPPELCLRADVLEAIRQFNTCLPSDQQVQVHLVDIDSPLSAIRQHLLDVRDRLGATSIDIPDEQTL